MAYKHTHKAIKKQKASTMSIVVFFPAIIMTRKIENSIANEPQPTMETT